MNIILIIVVIAITVGIVKTIKKKRLQENLLEAIRMHNKEAVQKIIAKGADVNYVDDNSYGRFPLQLAVENGDKEIVSLLIEKGAINHCGALVTAVTSGNKEMVSFLISKGAKVNLDYNGKLPLDFAEDDEIIALLKNHGAKTKGELDEAKREQAAKEEVARKERCKLIDACKWGHLDEAKRLIESGFDLEVRDEKGQTALMIVVNSLCYINSSGKLEIENALEKNNDIAKLLIQHGAEIDARDNKGQTAAMHSALKLWQHLPLLIESGADVNAKDKKGTTVLMWACLNSAKTVKHIEFLISKGADVNAKENSNDETALMFAATAGNVEAVATLIKNGADVNARAHNGATALSAAKAQGFTEIENLLRKIGARY